MQNCFNYFPPNFYENGQLKSSLDWWSHWHRHHRPWSCGRGYPPQSPSLRLRGTSLHICHRNYFRFHLWLIVITMLSVVTAVSDEKKLVCCHGWRCRAPSCLWVQTAVPLHCTMYNLPSEPRLLWISGWSVRSLPYSPTAQAAHRCLVGDEIWFCWLQLRNVQTTS